MPNGSQSIRQAAAIPWRAGQICLVTSSSGKRWVLPKGCIEPGKSAAEIALQEAWEEAGLTGTLERGGPVGSYLYEKLGSTYHVLVFIMNVMEVADTFPEWSLRERCWLKPRQAMLRIEDPGLRAIIRGSMAGRTMEIRQTAAD